MRPTHSLLKQLIAVSGLFGFVLFILYHELIVGYRYLPVQKEETRWVNAKPAGEITEAFVLEQSLDIQAAEITEKEFGDTFCMYLLMSNYKNRRNFGTFSVTIILGEARQEKIVRASQIIDNEYEKVCFEAFPFRAIYQSDARVEIKGIDGQPRRSVTAWISTSPGGGRAIINGAPTDHTLVYRAYVQKNNVESYQRGAYLLIFIASWMMGLLVMATYHRRQN